MQVFVINLKRRPDRLASVVAALPKAWLECAEFTTNWPGPVDGSTIQSEKDLEAAQLKLYSGWQLKESNNSWWKRPLKLGEIGCSFSHLSVWRRAKEAFSKNDALTHVIILEDDVHFTSGTGNVEGEKDAAPEKLQRVLSDFKEAGVDWDLLYLGRVLQGGKTDFPPNNPHLLSSGLVVEPGFSYCLFGYVLSRTGVEKLLNAEFETHVIPVDEFVPACYMMHPRLDIAQLFPPVLKAYAIETPIAFQRTKLDAGSDTESSKIMKIVDKSKKEERQRIRVRIHFYPRYHGAKV